MVGLCGGTYGSFGVGKTVAANCISNNFMFYKCDLSLPVTESAKILCGWNGNKDRNGLEIINRVCMGGRKKDENYWLNIALASIPDGTENVVFDNVYFLNEFKFIQENGGKLIKIVRNDFEDPALDFVCDDVVYNKDSVASFEKSIYNLTKTIFNI